MPKYLAFFSKIFGKTDYLSRIDNLDWTRLTGGRTKNVLFGAWTNRQRQLIKEKKEKERYQELKSKIESGGEYIIINKVKCILEIKELTSEEKRNELQGLLKRKVNEWQEAHSEEEKLNKELESFRNSSYLNSIYDLIKKGWIKLINSKGEDPIDEWFNELERLLQKNDYQFLKEVCGEISDEKREDLFSGIFSELKEERKKIKTKKDFKKNDYFTKIRENEIKKYVREIFKVVNERLIEDEKKEEEEIKGDISSIMKEVEKIEEEFVSNAETSQKKIEKIIVKLSKSIVNNAKKFAKDLTNEKKVMSVIASLVGKIKEAKKAVEIAREVITDYLDGKDLSKEEQKKWISELELKTKDAKNAREVSQCLKNLFALVNNNNNNNPWPITPIVISLGFITLLGLIVYKFRKNKFKK